MVVNLFIVYELDRWSQDLNAKFTLKDCLFGNVKTTKSADPNTYSYSGFGIGFDSPSLFSIPNFDWGKNAIVFGVDMASSVHAKNRNKNILILGKGQTQGLDHKETFYLNLHYNGANSYLFVNCTKCIKFKAKDSETVSYPMCLGIFQKTFL